MATLAYELLEFGPGSIEGRPAAKYLGIGALGGRNVLARDFRHETPTTGTISDQVVIKAAGVDLPFANGRVWLLRLADGYKAWEGWSDAAGNYTATGLEMGVQYIAVGIDPYKNQKATGAGPVTAT